MRVTLLHRMDTLARQLAPAALTVGFVFCTAVPLRVPGLDVVAPALPLISVFYWSLYRPDLMPPLAAFAVGLFEDILSGTTIGVSAATFVLVHAAVHAQRRFFLGKTFLIVWLGFALIAVSAFALQWLVTSLVYGMLIESAALLTRVLITIGCYPAVAWLLLKCHVSLLRTA
jgi:rod shape-determining protein MreD